MTVTVVVVWATIVADTLFRETVIISVPFPIGAFELIVTVKPPVCVPVCG